MSADEKEAEALRLLSEVAAERYRAECSLLRVEMRAAGRLLSVLDCDPRAVTPSAAPSAALSAG